MAKGSGYSKRDHGAPEKGVRSTASVAERLRQTRQALGMTITEFARAADIPQNTYSQYESGVSRPTIANALRLCDAYELSLDWIYQGKAGELKTALLEKIKAQRGR